MRALLLSRYWPPWGDAESIVSAKVGAALAQAGVELQVLGGLPVERSDLSPQWRQLLPAAELLPGLGALTALRRRLPMGFPRLAWDDLEARAWACRARRRGAELLRHAPVDVILTRTLPYWSLQAGRDLARRFKVPWIACINDPPLSLHPPAYTWKRQAWVDRLEAPLRRLAPEALRQADAVVFPSQRLADWMQERMGLDLADRLAIIPHIGWRADPEPGDGVLRIMHLGAAFRRSPVDVLRGLQTALDEVGAQVPVRVQYVGAFQSDVQGELERADVRLKVEVVPRVGYFESLQMMQRAGALLLVEAPLEEGIFLPSKLADYAASGKPVLMYCPPRGAVADLVGTGHPGFMGQSEEGATQVFRRLLTALREDAGLGAFTINPEPFSASSVGGQLLALMERVARR